MYTIILCIVISLFVNLFIIKHSKGFELFFTTSLLVVITGIVGVWLMFALPMDLTVCNSEQKIITLQDNNSIKGSFYLGTGNIDGKMKYVYYYEFNGMYVMEQLDYNLVKVRFVQTAPRVLKFTKCATDSWINNFAYDFDVNVSSYIIEVPEGTIKTNFNLDAQ